MTPLQIFLIFVGLNGATFLAFAYWTCMARRGYEDKDGFHYGEDEEPEAFRLAPKSEDSTKL